MSLRAFHILFIILSIVLAAGCAAWAFANGVSVVFGVVSALTAVALAVYFVSFLKKTRRIIL